ncbi:MAG: formylglycine-generating enzyme family protein [Vulcanimicrobiota bacterium]
MKIDPSQTLRRRLIRVSRRVNADSLSAEQHQQLGQDLSALSQAAISRFETLEQTNSRRRQLGKMLSLANTVATYTAVASGLTGTSGVALATAAARQRAVEGFSELLTETRSFLEAPQVQQVGPQNPPAEIPWVEVPAGKFLFGPDKTEVDLPTYRISKYPVTNWQFQQFVEATGYEPHGSWHVPEGGYGEGPDGEANHPAVNVSFHDARAYARWAGGRLASEEEWEKAARGTDGRLYPWGNQWRPESCNNDSYGTTPVSAFEEAGNVSPYGAVDMVGNVLEWVDGGTARRPGAVLLKGGAWSNSRAPGAGQLDDPFGAVRQTSEYPDSTYAGFGFRIVTDQPVGTRFEPPAPVGAEEPPQLSQAHSELMQQLHQPLTELANNLQEGRPWDGALEQKIRRTLLDVTREARELRPLGGKADTRVTRKEAARIHGAANRLASLMTAAATGSAPIATTMVKLGLVEDLLRGSLAYLESRAKLVEPKPIDRPKPAEAMFDFAEIPAGPTRVGREGKEVHLDAFRMSKQVVSNKQFLAFVTTTGYKPEGGWRPPAGGVYPHEKQGLEPAVNVSFFDARAFCEWAGCRLPSEHEWEKAAGGPDGVDSAWESGRLIADHGRIEAVDHQHYVSPHGVQGMVGNVLEWVEGGSEKRPGSVLLKGGAWSNGGFKPFSVSRHSTDLPNSSYGGFGFRVAL